MQTSLSEYQTCVLVNGESVNDTIRLNRKKTMNNVITVTFDGQVLTPEIPLYLSQNKKYKIAIIVIPIKIGTF